MRKTVGLAAFTLFLLAADDAHACGVCMDQQIVFNIPFVIPVFVLYLAWLMCAFIARCLRWPRELEQYGLFPSLRGLIQAVVISIGGYPVFWILTTGSILTPALLIGAVWLFFMISRTMAFGTRTLPPELAHFRKFKVAFIGVQLLFLFAVGVAVPLGFAYGRSTPVLVYMLSADNSGVRGQVIRELSTKDESAAGPLIAICRPMLANPTESNFMGRLSAALYCLGRIGGADASKFLAAEFREKVNFQKDDDAPWQRALCFAYAQSAGMKAVSDLRDLYEKNDHGTAGKERWAILVALLKTGSKPGVAFVLDHDDVLMATDNRTTRVALAALLVRDDLQALKDLPVSVDLGSRAYVDQREMQEYLDTYVRVVGNEGLWPVWEKGKVEMRRRWLGNGN